MKSFLLNSNNKPIVKWTLVPKNAFFEGNLPKDHYLAICPGEYIVLDVDVKNGKNGFNYIPSNIYFELRETFNYKTKSGGSHYWLKYLGNRDLMNKPTIFGLDLRVKYRGYVRYYHEIDIRDCIHLIKETSTELNKWLEKLFCSNERHIL